MASSPTAPADQERFLPPGRPVLVVAGVLAVVVLVSVLALGGNDDGGKSNQAAAPTGALVVDRDSLGGECDDTHSVEVASSPKTPWCTVKKALDAAPPGSEVRLRKGSYPGVDVPAERVRGRLVTFRPYPGEQVTLAHAGTFPRGGNVRIEGFKIPGGIGLTRGATNVQVVDNDVSPGGFYLDSTRNVLIEGNKIHDRPLAERALLAQGRAVKPGDPGNLNLTIRNNRFYNLTYDAIAIYTGATNLLVEGNEIYNVRKPAAGDLHVDTIQSMGGRNLVFRNNYLHDSTHGLLVKDTPAMGLRVENNVVARIAGTGITIANAPGARVTNNTTWQTKSGLLLGDLRRFSEKTSAVVRNNIFEAIDSFPPSLLKEENYNLVVRGEPQGENSITGQPKFRSPGKGDFTPAEGSPAIDAGTSRGAPGADRLGRRRGDRVDLGAVERAEN